MIVNVALCVAGLNQNVGRTDILALRLCDGSKHFAPNYNFECQKWQTNLK